MSPIKAESCLESWNCHLFLFFHVGKKFLAKPKMELVRKTEGNWMKLFHFQLVNFNLQKHCQLVSSEGRMQTRLKIYQCIRYLHHFWWFFYIMCELWKNTFLGLVKSVWCSPCQNWNCQLPLGTTKRFKTRKTCVWCPIKCSWQKCFYR